MLYEAGRFHATADLGLHRLVANASKSSTLVLVFNSIADLMGEDVIARLQTNVATGLALVYGLLETALGVPCPPGFVFAWLRSWRVSTA